MTRESTFWQRITLDAGARRLRAENRHCQECGMLLGDSGEYHPYSFCVLKKAGLDPWQEVRMIAGQLSLGDPGHRPPLVSVLVGKP